MTTNYSLLGKGLRNLGILVLLFILSPVVLTIGFKALKVFESPKIWAAYGLVGIGFLLILFSVFFAFKTFKTIMNALFND